MENKRKKGVFSVSSGEMDWRIRAICNKSGKSLSELGEALGLSPSGFVNRIKTERFTKEEYEQMAAFIGCKYVCYIEMPDGEVIC